MLCISKVSIFAQVVHIHRDLSYAVTLAPLGVNPLSPRKQSSLLQIESVNMANPRWSASEVVWRVLNVVRAVQAQAALHQSTTPVASFLALQGTTGLDASLFPPTLRSLLVDNAQVITSSNQPWVGRSNPSGLSEVAPFPGIQVAHAGGSGIRSVCCSCDRAKLKPAL